MICEANLGLSMGWKARKNGESWTCVTADRAQWVTVLMATSRIFGRGDFSILDVASITVLKTLTMLKRYTHLGDEDLARKSG